MKAKETLKAYLKARPHLQMSFEEFGRVHSVLGKVAANVYVLGV